MFDRQFVEQVTVGFWERELYSYMLRPVTGSVEETAVIRFDSSRPSDGLGSVSPIKSVLEQLLMEYSQNPLTFGSMLRVKFLEFRTVLSEYSYGIDEDAKSGKTFENIKEIIKYV